MGLVRSAFETLLTRALVTLIGVVITILVARSLGPEGRGIFTIAMTIAAIGVQVGHLGLSSSNVYYASANQGLLNMLIGNTLFFGVVGSTLVVLLIWLVFLYWPTYAPVSGPILSLALVWVPIGIGMLLIQNLYLGMHKVRIYNFIELAKQVGTLLSILFVYLLGYESPELYFLVSLLIIIVIFIAVVIHIISGQGYRPEVSSRLFVEHAKYGIKAYFAMLFAYLVLRIDLLMIQYLQGELSTGLYSIAVAIADVLILVPVAIGTVLFPRLSSLENDRERWLLTSRVVHWVILVMVISTGLLLFIGSNLLVFLFGQEYSTAVPAMKILIPAVAILGINVVFMNYFASLGMPMISVISPALAAIVNIPANYLLIPIMGIIGAAWASLISYSLMLIMSLGYIRLLQKSSKSHEV